MNTLRQDEITKDTIIHIPLEYQKSVYLNRNRAKELNNIDEEVV